MAEGKTGRCGSCRWYGEPEEWARQLRGERLGTCDLAGSTDALPDFPETLAFALDSEECGAGLYVSVSFGCVQWAAREGVADA